MAANQPTDDDGVLPYELESPHPNHGVGAYEHIVALSGYTDAEVDAETQVTDDGRCFICGYDRGVLKAHTEVPGRVLECRQCERVLLKEEP